MKPPQTPTPTPDDVLSRFAPFQAKSAGMVAEEFGVDRQTAAALLDELAERRTMTKVYGNTDTPVWLRRSVG
ncbi:hypothetical protein ACFO0N_00995 [Halobium salinum]|uniref:Uncharacterized protein n=1 Tax=Halobium salinum TaxID=1364940 RepID=A0ABD5P719_9EURY|nr:hypothetical protein [Halobium salinum]